MVNIDTERTLSGFEIDATTVARYLDAIPQARSQILRKPKGCASSAITQTPARKQFGFRVDGGPKTHVASAGNPRRDFGCDAFRLQ